MWRGILAGRFSQRGNNLAISVELIDGRDRSQVWGEQYISKAANLLQVSAEISRDVAAKLHVQPAAAQPPPPRDPRDAPVRKRPELLLKGRPIARREGTEEREKAAELLRQGHRRRTRLAIAHADLSDIYRSLVSSGRLDTG